MKILLAILILALPLSANAQLVSFTGGNDLITGEGTAGWKFAPNTSLTLQALGIWESSGEGLFNVHTVGLWDADTKSLLRSTVIQPTAAVKVGEFWYANITPITLTAGHEYVLGATYSDNDFDFARGNVISVTTSGITLGDAVLSTGTGFEYPNLNVSGANAGFFGPNGLTTPVPEPALFGVVASLLLFGFAAIRKRAGAWLCLALLTTLSGVAADRPTVSIRAVLDAKPAERQRLLAILAQQRPATKQTLIAAGSPPVVPAENRPPVTPGNVNGLRPVVPPGLRNYASP